MSYTQPELVARGWRRAEPGYFYRPFGVGVEHFRIASQFEEWKDAAVAAERAACVNEMKQACESGIHSYGEIACCPACEAVARIQARGTRK